MLIILICFVVGVIRGFASGYSDADVVTEGIFGFFVGLLLYVFLGGFIAVCFQFPTQDVVEEIDIVALNDTNSNSNINYIVTCNTEDNYIYRYMIETERGKQVQELENKSNVYLLEGNYVPKIVKHNTEFVNMWHYLVGHHWFLSDNYIEIFVPSGTITDNYSIDLE